MFRGRECKKLWAAARRKQAKHGVSEFEHSAKLHAGKDSYIIGFKHFEFTDFKAMKQRQWVEDEKNKLLDLIEQNHGFLFDGLTPHKTKQMVDQKWMDIFNEINALGMGSSPLTVKKAK